METAVTYDFFFYSNFALDLKLRQEIGQEVVTYGEYALRILLLLMQNCLKVTADYTKDCEYITL